MEARNGRHPAATASHAARLTESLTGDKAVTIDDPEVFRAVMDPFRLKILEALKTPRTAKELAAALRVAPNRLYYHLHRLERHHVIEVVDETRRANVVERRYRNTMPAGFDVTPELLPLAIQLTGGVVGPELVEVAAEYAAAFGKAAARGEVDAMSATTFMTPRRRLSRKRAEALQLRLVDLVEEFFGRDAPPEADGDTMHGLMLALTPLPEAEAGT